MDDKKVEIEQLIILKKQLETAFEINDQDEIKRCFQEFKNAYESYTRKKFEEGIPKDKLDSMQAILDRKQSVRTEIEETLSDDEKEF